MSASDPTITAFGQSALADPADALREALAQIGKQLAASGAAPHHLQTMTWRAKVPADFYPSRRVIDAAYREVFVGFRPPIRFERSDIDGIAIEATATQPATPDPTPVWRGYSRPELAAQYSARSQVADMQPVFRQWRNDGAAFRGTFRSLDLAYGPSADETLDLYTPDSDGPWPLWVFIHGGYWQAVTKAQNAQFAKGLVQAGFAVANLDYGLCPDTSLDEAVAQVKRALQFLARHATDLNIDPRRISLTGHSAGGHLAGLMLADSEAPAIHSALLISGLFELAPLALLPMGRLLGLSDQAAIDRLSVSTKRPRRKARVALALGGLESDEFKRQSDELAASWQLDAPLIVEGRHHFSILDTLVSGDLLNLALKVSRS